jgi:Leucine-rich repeat (LRR) protein
LEELWLKSCELLWILPLSSSKLTKLKLLNLEKTALEIRQEDFAELCSLEEAYFSFCKNLTTMPESLWNLSNLEVLYLDGCDQIQKLPPSICLLWNLKEICLSYMALEDLPEEFGQLQCLRQADFEDCNLLRSLCTNFGCLGSLQDLNLKGCSSLVRLPDSFSDLANLENLDLRGCRLLQTYPHSTERLIVLLDGDDGM